MRRSRLASALWLAAGVLLLASALPLASATKDCSLRNLILRGPDGNVIPLSIPFSRTRFSGYKARIPFEMDHVYLEAVSWVSSTLIRITYKVGEVGSPLVQVGQVSSSGERSEGMFVEVGDNIVAANVVCDCAFTYKIEICREPFVYTKGDPIFAGLMGQEFQVHGVAGEVYNVISDRQMQMNSRFVFLDHGECPILNGRKANACWSHPGSYLGEIGIKTSGGDRILIASGGAREGFQQVQLNRQDLEFDEVMPLTVANTPPHNQVEGEERLQMVNAPQVVDNDFWVVRNSTHLVSLRLSNFLLQIENSDHFVNYRVRVLDWSALPGTHGLLGQTYRPPSKPGKQVKEIEGNVDDYQIENHSLWGDDFVFNRFGK